MMSRFLTYSLTLLTLLAGLFVMSACQKEEVGKSEVMMTFNTRAIVSDKVSDADELERMNDLRVIMVNQDGMVVDNHLATDIDASSVKFTFETPVKTTGEYFTFYAIANENALTPVPTEKNELSWMKTCERYVELTDQNIIAIKTQEIGNNSAFSIPNAEAIPQTKIWTVYVPQQDKYTVPDPLQLEFVASRISVKFVNKTNESQSLSNIKITGITPNGKGRLFSDYIKQGLVDVYEEVYVTNDVILSDGIPFTAVNNLSAGATSDVQNYYTYPVDEANISNPMLYATWGGKEFHMPIGVTSIPRNKHIEIVVTLLKDKLTVNYNIVDWKEHNTNIGNNAPTTPDDGYNVEDWFADNNIEIGGGTVDAPVWDLGGGITLEGEEVETNWETEIGLDAGLNDYISGITLPDNMDFEDIKGYIILIEFVCHNDNGHNENGDLKFDVQFVTDHGKVFSKRNINDDGNEVEPFAWSDEQEKGESVSPYVRYVRITKEIIDYIDENSNNQNLFNIRVVNAGTQIQQGLQIALKKFKLIRPID